MSRTGDRKRGRGGNLPPFVPLSWDLLNSKAYKELPFAASKILPHFIGKVKVRVPYRDPEFYTTTFTFSYAEVKKYGLASGTFSKSIQNLVQFGLIDPVDKGGLRGYGKGYNRYRLSERWRKFGERDFESRDWKTFQPRNIGI